jgi:hypothetical protein
MQYRPDPALKSNVLVNIVVTKHTHPLPNQEQYTICRRHNGARSEPQHLIPHRDKIIMNDTGSVLTMIAEEWNLAAHERLDIRII